MFSIFTLRDNNMGFYIQFCDYVIRSVLCAVFHSTLTPGSSCPNLLDVGCIDYNVKFITFNIANGYELKRTPNTVSIILHFAIFSYFLRILDVVQQLSKLFDRIPSPLKDPPPVVSVICQNELDMINVHYSAPHVHFQGPVQVRCNFYWLLK